MDKPFIGQYKEIKKDWYTFSPGSDEFSLNTPVRIACDCKGNIYVYDSLNNRIQVFSSKGKYIKTIKVDKPSYVCVPQKTVAIYVLHGRTP